VNLVCANTGKFKTILKTACKIAPELVIDASIEGLKIHGVSSNHLIAFGGIISPAFFQEYRYNDQEQIIICFESKTLSNVLSRINPNDKIRLELKDCGITFFLNKPYQRVFIVNKKDIWERPLQIKNFMKDAAAIIKPDIFYEIIMDASKVADELTIRATNDLVTFIAEGCSCSFTYEQKVVNNKIERGVSITILTASLAPLIPLTRESETITLQLLKEGPLIINYNLEENKASFSVIISGKT